MIRRVKLATVRSASPKTPTRCRNPGSLGWGEPGLEPEENSGRKGILQVVPLAIRHQSPPTSRRRSSLGAAEPRSAKLTSMALVKNSASSRTIRERLAASGKAFYCVCFVGRSGSALLCDDLSQWRVGSPEGYFHFSPLRPDVPNLTEYLLRLVDEAPGGIFGFKISRAEMYPLTQRLRTEGENEVTYDLRTIFPNLLYIYLIRKNKIEQAVSLWRAYTSEVWHIDVGSTEAAGRPEYNFDELQTCFLKVIAEDWLWQDHFAQLNINPFVLYYEDYVRDRVTHLSQIAHYLGSTAPPTPLADRLTVTRDDWTARMVSRFAADLEVPRPYTPPSVPYRPWVDEVRSWLREGQALAGRAVRGLERRMDPARVVSHPRVVFLGASRLTQERVHQDVVDHRDNRT